MIDMHVGLLTLLKEFDAICRKHNITYYLEGGSLLGAVRHKGFLPWDDDVDLSITRDNFQKLLAVIDQELPENRELYCYERFPNYLRDTVKYTNLDTTVLFRNHILDGNAAGQHIDLFILDPVPSDPELQQQYKKTATVYSELLSPVYVLCDDIANYLDDYNKYFKMMEETGRENVLTLLREKLFSYEDSDACDTYLLRWGNRHVFYPKELFGEPVYLPFEDAMFPAPRQYHRFLRRQFGDSWMIIPEESQQEDHNTFDNYHIPCKTFIADYSPFIDYQQYWEENSKRKQYNLKLWKAKLRSQRSAVQCEAVLRELELAEITSSLTPEAKNWLDQENYAALAQYFSPYCSAQLSSDFLKEQLAISIDPDVLRTCTLSLVMCGQFGQAEKLLNINPKIAGTMQNIAELIRDVRGCVLACEEGCLEEAKEIAQRLIVKYPRQLNVAAFLIRQGIRDGQSPETLMCRLQELLACYPDNDELLLLMGMLLERLGKQDEAQNWYRRCKEITRNGLILMELPELPTETECPDTDTAIKEEGL